MSTISNAILRYVAPEAASLMRHRVQAASDNDTSYAGEWRRTQELLEKLDVVSGYCVDIAAGDGVTMCGTLPLWRRGWSGLAVEADRPTFGRLAFAYAQFPKVRLANALVTPATIAPLLRAFDVPPAFDFLNLDIDSYDLPVIEAALDAGYRPRLISMEINEKIPPPIYFSVLYSADHAWDGSHFYGCSATAAQRSLARRGYVLSCIEFNNAFFVSSDLADRVGRQDVADAYRTGYLDRPERFNLFPWNADMEDLHTMTPEQATAHLQARFANQRGRYVLSLADTCGD